jgi:hypothetical protein
MRVRNASRSPRTASITLCFCARIFARSAADGPATGAGLVAVAPSISLSNMAMGLSSGVRTALRPLYVIDLSTGLLPPVLNESHCTPNCRLSKAAPEVWSCCAMI